MSDSSISNSSYISPQELKWLLIQYKEGTLEPTGPSRRRAPQGRLLIRPRSSVEPSILRTTGISLTELLEKLRSSSEDADIQPEQGAESTKEEPEFDLAEDDPRRENPLVQQLLSRKEEFRFIFETNDNSLFFGLANGCTIRFKFERDGSIDTRYSDTSLWRDIFFVDKFQYNAMRTQVDVSESTHCILGEELEVHPLRPELFPFCFGKEGHSRIRYEKVFENVIRLLGDADGGLAGGLMFGNFVTRIIKAPPEEGTALSAANP
jgi:hypothetical protein